MDKKTKEYLDSQYNPGFIREGKVKEHPGAGTGTQVAGYVPEGMTAQEVMDGKAVEWNARKKAQHAAWVAAQKEKKESA